MKTAEDAVHSAVYQKMQQRVPNGHWVCHKRFCKAIPGLSNPVGIWCQNDVISTSMRRNHVASTLIRRHLYVMCPLGSISSLIIDLEKCLMLVCKLFTLLSGVDSIYFDRVTSADEGKFTPHMRCAYKGRIHTTQQTMADLMKVVPQVVSHCPIVSPFLVVFLCSE